jgi:hypothetical protein
MKNGHLTIIALSFLTILISLYYGMSIQNAQDNFLVEHLYLNEGVENFDLDYIPTLGYKAAIITLFFLIIGFTIQFFIFLKTPFKNVKKLAIGALICFIIIFIFDFLTIYFPHDYNFKNYGMIWILLSLTTIFINGVSLFVKK